MVRTSVVMAACPEEKVLTALSRSWVAVAVGGRGRAAEPSLGPQATVWMVGREEANPQPERLQRRVGPCNLWCPELPVWLWGTVRRFGNFPAAPRLLQNVLGALLMLGRSGGVVYHGGRKRGPCWHQPRSRAKWPSYQTSATCLLTKLLCLSMGATWT